MKLDYNIIISRIDELKSLNVYLPIVLHRYVGVDYLYDLSPREKRKFYKHRVELMGAGDYNKYLEDELTNWLTEYPKFKNIIQKK